MYSKNNKGFTMIEILAAVIIMGVLLMIAVPAVSKLMKGFREDYYVELEETIEASAKEFYTDNKIYRPDGLLKTSYTSIDSLIKKKYVEKLVDYKGKSCSLKDDESYVVVIYRGGNDYEYKACIKCAEDDYISDTDGTYCDPAWRTNDNIKYNFGESEDLYIYHNTSKEEVRKKLLQNVSIVKYNKKGETLDRIVLAESNKENVLPVDIDNLDTSVALGSSNMLETTLHYDMEGVTKELKVIIYKHKEPIVDLKDVDGSNYSGDWTNKVIVTLTKNDNFFEMSNTSIANFQLNYNDSSWKNIDCEMKTNDTCSFSIEENANGSYKFRIVTNEGKISDETLGYTVKVDRNKPNVSITPNGDEPIINVGSTNGTISFNLSTSDTGGSEIKSRKYAISTSSTKEPTTFTNFFTNDIDVSKSLEGNKYYVWAQVEDYAGNISTEVWPSAVFTMKYEVIYDANGGSGAPGTTYKKYDENLTLSGTKPTRDGYTFKGWSTSRNGSVSYNSGSNYTDNKSIRLYAVWESNRPSATVGSTYTVCPSDNSSKTEAQCLSEQYNRLNVSNINYNSSNGALSFDWKMTMNVTTVTWSGTCPDRIMCVARMGDSTCLGDWSYSFSIGSSNWLGIGKSTSGSGSVTIDNSWSSGSYRLIVKHNPATCTSTSYKGHFSFDTRNTKTLFTIN